MVDVVEWFPGMVVVVLGEPERMVTVFVEECTVDLESVGVVALGATVREEEDSEVVARVTLEVNVWYVPVGVFRSVTERDFVPVRNVRPSVVSDGSWATARDRSKMPASPKPRRDAMVPSIGAVSPAGAAPWQFPKCSPRLTLD